MNGGFAKGMLIGGIIGASISMMVGPDMNRNKMRKRMMRTGRTFIKKSGNIIGDVVDIFR